MKIPFYSLNVIHQPLKSKILGAFSQIIDNNKFILGEEVAIFEHNFAKYCDSNFAIGV